MYHPHEPKHLPVVVKDGKVYCPTCQMMCGLMQDTAPVWPEPPPCDFGETCPARIDLSLKSVNAQHDQEPIGQGIGTRSCGPMKKKPAEFLTPRQAEKRKENWL